MVMLKSNIQVSDTARKMQMGDTCFFFVVVVVVVFFVKKNLILFSGQTNLAIKHSDMTNYNNL